MNSSSAHTEILPLFGRLSRVRAASGVRGAHRSPDRGRHQRGRDLADRSGHPVCRRQRVRPHVTLLETHEGAATPHRTDVAGLGGPTGRAAAAGSGRGSRSGSTTRDDYRLTTPSSPTPRSCARTSHPCSCEWLRSVSGASTTSRSSTPPTSAPSRTGSTRWWSSGPSPTGTKGPGAG